MAIMRWRKVFKLRARLLRGACWIWYNSKQVREAVAFRSHRKDKERTRRGNTCAMDEIDFNADDFSDLVAKDKRYPARAYAVLMTAINSLNAEKDASYSATDILDAFHDLVLDQYGPLAHTVLTECKRIGSDEHDSAEGFANGYDFKEEFLMPYQAD